jgi:putative transposase
VRRNHSVGITAFHLEWCPKYRYKVLGGNWLKQVLTESISMTAKEYGMQIFAMEIGQDHIHLFVNLPPAISVAGALQLFKGRSSKEIFAACPSFRETYGKGHFWSRGSFYRSVSNVGSDTIYKYITEHRTKELATSVEAAEKTFDQMSIVSFM